MAGPVPSRLGYRLGPAGFLPPVVTFQAPHAAEPEHFRPVRGSSRMNDPFRLALLLLLFIIVTSCASRRPALPYERTAVPAPPDYGRAENWAALPTKTDAADRVPSGNFTDRQATAAADVFFVHPTIYQGNDPEQPWNAALGDMELNEKVDESTILNQATVFNAAGRVYAPRYRQAHLRVFYPRGQPDGERALDTAYADVRTAFRYYLENYNDGRPFVIASHSQGTVHAERLIRDEVDGRPTQKQLVAAYLVGMPIAVDAFQSIPVCADSTQTGCFVSWRTVRDDFTPDDRPKQRIAVVNPLSWRTDEAAVPKEQNQGTILLKFDKNPEPGMVGAQVRGGRLYTNKPGFFGNIFFTRKNYHVADYNFFWVDVRRNAEARVEAFTRK